jgi:hypothetical protein
MEHLLMSTLTPELGNTETHRHKKGRPRTARKRRLNAETRLMETIKKTHTACMAKIENDTSESDAARPFFTKLRDEIDRKLPETPHTPAAMIGFVEWILAKFEGAKSEVGAGNIMLKAQAQKWEELLRTLRWRKQKSELEHEEKMRKKVESAEIKNRRERIELDNEALEKLCAWMKPTHRLNISRNRWVVIVFGTKESVERLKTTTGNESLGRFWAIETREVQSSVGTAYEVKISNTVWVRKFHLPSRSHGNGDYLGRFAL